jgi:predicted DNA-binding protein (UPF0251 family)
MARPRCCRKIARIPEINFFVPDGVRPSDLEEVILNLDEFEAVKLADLHGLYQDRAALEMNISRQTFGRLIESARKKIADALVNGKALKIDGGDVEVAPAPDRCSTCRHRVSTSDCGRKGQCPHCGQIMNK